MIGWQLKLYQSAKKRSKQKERLNTKAQKLGLLQVLPDVVKQVSSFNKRRNRLTSISKEA